MQIHTRGAKKIKRQVGGRPVSAKWQRLRTRLAAVRSLDAWAEVRLTEFGRGTTEQQLRNAVAALNRRRQEGPPKGYSWGVTKDGQDPDLFRLILGKKGRH